MIRLERVRIVLVRTFHPGNIGSAARSMKNMGLTDLCLVSPKDFPSDEATKMAAGAKDMLNNVRIESSLAAAVSDCTTIVASTARPRSYDLPELLPEEAAQRLVSTSAESPVALIFGPERMGLHNDDIRLAKYRVTIPANVTYNSLNMAAAVQTLSYEIFKAANSAYNEKTALRELPTSSEIEHLYTHLEQVLKQISFLRPHQGETMDRIRHLVTRAEPDVLELNILRGILSAIEKSIAAN